VSAQQISRLEAVRLALAEVGDVSDEDLAAAVGRYGAKIPPAYVRVAKAQLRGLQALEESRRKARELLASMPQKPKRRGGRPKRQEEPPPQG
jgi:hypothetical protein